MTTLIIILRIYNIILSIVWFKVLEHEVKNEKIEKVLLVIIFIILYIPSIIPWFMPLHLNY